LDAAVLPVQRWESDTLAQAGKLYRASTEFPMKITIEIRYANNNPVLLCDPQDNVIRVIDDNEIYSANLHRREVMEN
jgi:hypothetical protein